MQTATPIIMAANATNFMSQDEKVAFTTLVSELVSGSRGNMFTKAGKVQKLVNIHAYLTPKDWIVLESESASVGIKLGRTIDRIWGYWLSLPE